MRIRRLIRMVVEEEEEGMEVAGAVGEAVVMEEAAEVDEVDSGTEADGAAEVVTTTLVLLMPMVGRAADKPLLLPVLLLLLAERLDECVKRTVRTFWWQHKSARRWFQHPARRAEQHRIRPSRIEHHSAVHWNMHT